MSYAYIKFGKNSMPTYDFVYDQTFCAYSDLGRSHKLFGTHCIYTLYTYIYIYILTTTLLMVDATKGIYKICNVNNNNYDH